MPLVSELRGDSGTAAEACSTIDFASMSEMKESEKTTSYWEAVSCEWCGGRGAITCGNARISLCTLNAFWLARTSGTDANKAVIICCIVPYGALRGFRVVTSVLEMEEWHQRYRLRPRRRYISDALGEYWGQVVYFSLPRSISPISALHVIFYFRDFRNTGILQMILSTYKSVIVNSEAPTTSNLSKPFQGKQQHASPYTRYLQTYSCWLAVLCNNLTNYDGQKGSNDTLRDILRSV